MTFGFWLDIIQKVEVCIDKRKRAVNKHAETIASLHLTLMGRSNTAMLTVHSVQLDKNDGGSNSNEALARYPGTKRTATLIDRVIQSKKTNRSMLFCRLLNSQPNPCSIVFASQIGAYIRVKVYRDFASMRVEQVSQLLCVNTDMAKRLSEAYTQELFPSKLHAMIESSATTSLSSDIIYWLPHG